MRGFRHISCSSQNNLLAWSKRFEVTITFAPVGNHVGIFPYCLEFPPSCKHRFLLVSGFPEKSFASIRLLTFKHFCVRTENRLPSQVAVWWKLLMIDKNRYCNRPPHTRLDYVQWYNCPHRLAQRTKKDKLQHELANDKYNVQALLALSS